MTDPTTRLLADRLARRAIFDRSGGASAAGPASFTQEALADLIEQALNTYREDLVGEFGKIETLEFELGEARGEASELRSLLESGLLVDGIEDGEDIYAPLVVQRDGDPSVGILNHSWLEIGEGYTVRRA